MRPLCRAGSVKARASDIAVRRAASSDDDPLSGAASSRQPVPAMFVIELTYTADLSEIDAHMSAHVAFLKKYYAAGKFLVSGRQVPRTGGIIVAVGEDREQIEAIIKEDPFHRHGLAEFRIVQFRASQR